MSIREKIRSATLISTLILTVSGIISRIIGFFYRIFLSNTIGAEGIGLFTLIMPVFAICFSICGGAYQTTISAFIAAEKKRKGSPSALFAGLILSITSSVLICAILYRFCDEIAILVFHEKKCSELIRLLAFTIPLSSIHSCINGYFYGISRSGFAAISQLIEQASRVIFVYLYYLYLSSKNISVNPGLAVAGLTMGELFSVLFLAAAFLCISRRSELKADSLSVKKYLTPVFLMSYPLILNRLILSLLSCLEALLIPKKLIAYGLSSSQALSYYGILNGMSMPFILFPGAFTNSLAVILLPNIAKLCSEGNVGSISKTITKSIQLCLSLGIIFTSIFFFSGKYLGEFIFKQEAAGAYIKNLSLLCPFIYLSTTLSSILNGLGKTRSTLLQSCISNMIRLLFISVLIPVYGMKAYLWGILVSWIVLTVLNVVSLYRIIPFCFYPQKATL